MLVVIVGIIIVIVAVVALWLISSYNGIITRRNRCDNAWQQIDAQLQRRSDLVPNLLESVKGYASHEQRLIESISAARTGMLSAATPADTMAADGALTAGLRQLVAVSKTYPELKANENFHQLQQQLEETENKITYARQSYNDCVLMYNNAIQTFPGSLLASFGDFPEKAGYQIPDASREAPSLKF